MCVVAWVNHSNICRRWCPICSPRTRKTPNYWTKCLWKTDCSIFPGHSSSTRIFCSWSSRFWSSSSVHLSSVSTNENTVQFSYIIYHDDKIHVRRSRLWPSSGYRNRLLAKGPVRTGCWTLRHLSSKTPSKWRTSSSWPGWWWTRRTTIYRKNNIQTDSVYRTIIL